MTTILFWNPGYLPKNWGVSCLQSTLLIHSIRLWLADKIGLTTDGIKYHLDKLRLANIIRHVGATKAGVGRCNKLRF
jgi:hypothetical protein